MSSNLSSRHESKPQRGGDLRVLGQTDRHAATVVAGDCGCLMNITGAIEHAGVKVAGKHLAEFLWERIHA